MAILTLEQVSMSFGALKAVKDVSFEVNNEILGLIGPNGSGKTTLINCITGVYKPQGTITLGQENITRLPPHQIFRKGIARTFQIPRPFTRMTVRENILVSAQDEKDVDEILRLVGLLEKKDLPAGKLTFPELRKLEIARALAGRPKLLLLDEAISGLNPTESAQMVQMEYSMIITFALSILLKKVALTAFGPSYRSLPEFFTGQLTFGEISVPYNLLFASGVSILLIAVVSLFLKSTWRGRAFRALSMSRNGAKILGVNIPVNNAIVFGFSAALAAVAGGILAPVTLIYPTVGSAPLIKGYEILAIGGLGSVPGSLVAGILLGLVESIGSVLFSSAYRDFYGFGLLVVFLIFRPKGLFGQD